MYQQCRKTLCGYQIDRCLFTLKSNKKDEKLGGGIENSAAVRNYTHVRY